MARESAAGAGRAKQVVLLFVVPVVVLAAVAWFIISTGGDDSDVPQEGDGGASVPMLLADACAKASPVVKDIDPYSPTDAQLRAVERLVTDFEQHGNGATKELADDLDAAVTPGLGKDSSTEGNLARFKATSDVKNAVAKHCG